MSRSVAPLALLLAAAACHRQPPPADNPQENGAAALKPGQPPQQSSEALAGDAGGARIGFRPLGSQAVKDAIYRAMATGNMQRWQDGKLTGYAVPGASGWKGCRAVRFTIDQVPDAAPGQINACR